MRLQMLYVLSYWATRANWRAERANRSAFRFPILIKIEYAFWSFSFQNFKIHWDITVAILIFFMEWSAYPTIYHFQANLISSPCPFSKQTCVGKVCLHRRYVTVFFYFFKEKIMLDLDLDPYKDINPHNINNPVVLGVMKYSQQCRDSG